MSAIIPESDLRVREQTLLARLNDQPRHGLETLFEAMSLGLAMGRSEVEPELLQDPKTAMAISAVTINMMYPTLIRDNVVRFITPKLETALRDPELEVEADEVKQLLLATAVLGHLQGRTKLG